MRTARALVPLINGNRPTSQAAITAATDALTRMAGEPPPCQPRFVGYQPTTGQRIAVYEADYTDAQP